MEASKLILTKDAIKMIHCLGKKQNERHSVSFIVKIKSKITKDCGNKKVVFISVEDGSSTSGDEFIVHLNEDGSVGDVILIKEIEILFLNQNIFSLPLYRIQRYDLFSRNSSKRDIYGGANKTIRQCISLKRLSCSARKSRKSGNNKENYESERKREIKDDETGMFNQGSPVNLLSRAVEQNPSPGQSKESKHMSSNIKSSLSPQVLPRCKIKEPEYYCTIKDGFNSAMQTQGYLLKLVSKFDRVYKTPHKPCESEYGGLKCSFIDTVGTIAEMTVFKEAAEFGKPLLNQDCIYEISNPRITTKQDNYDNREYIISNTINTTIREVESGDINLNRTLFGIKTTKISEVSKLPIQSTINIKCYVIEGTDLVVINTDNNTNLTKRTLIFGDDTGYKGDISGFREMADIQLNIGDIIVIQNVKIGNFFGKVQFNSPFSLVIRQVSDEDFQAKCASISSWKELPEKEFTGFDYLQFVNIKKTRGDLYSCYAVITEVNVKETTIEDSFTIHIDESKKEELVGKRRYRVLGKIKQNKTEIMVICQGETKEYGDWFDKIICDNRGYTKQQGLKIIVLEEFTKNGIGKGYYFKLQSCAYLKKSDKNYNDYGCKVAALKITEEEDFDIEDIINIGDVLD